MNLEQLEPLAREWTRQSGDMILRHFRDPELSVEHKEDASPVTIADREAEQLLRKLIREHFPEHGLMGEEFGPDREDAEWVWLIDPIDGTKSFVSGVPLFGTVLCLQREGRPIFGAIHLPALDEWIVGDGQTALRNGTPVQVREPVSLSDAVLLTSDERDIGIHQSEGGWKRLLGEVSYCRTWGDCYGYFLVATGQADIMVDPIVNPWDFHGVIPIIEGAGGRITNWLGENALGSDSAVVAHPVIHEEIIVRLNVK
ncbi:MAG: histidinol-phosphatase [Opitutales bacterium]